MINLDEPTDEELDSIAELKVVAGGARDIAALFSKMDPLDQSANLKDYVASAGVTEKVFLAQVRWLKKEGAENKKRDKATADDDKQGHALEFNHIEPWPEAVDGCSVLDGLVAEIERYIVMSPEQIAVCALWIAHTHAAWLRPYTPRLHISSPTKECGKSRLLEVIAEMAFNAVSVVGLKTATVYRLIEKHPVSLLMDEVDRYLSDDPELIGVLNRGHSKGGFVPRCVEPDYEVRGFKVFAPALFCGIGDIDDTLESRAIPIRLQRKRVDQTVAEFRIDRCEHLHELRSKLARFIEDNEARIAGIESIPPGGLSDRQKDGWRPLLALADVAGGRWPELARHVALTVHARNEFDEPTIEAMLIEDVWNVFKHRGVDRCATTLILDDLKDLEDRPWAEYGRQNKGLTPRQMSQRLRRYEIKPGTHRHPGQSTTFKGYLRDDFQEAHQIYVLGAQNYITPGKGVSIGNTVTHPSKTAENSHKTVLPIGSDDTQMLPIENPPKTAENSQKHGECYGVTDKNPETAPLIKKEVPFDEFPGVDDA